MFLLTNVHCFSKLLRFRLLNGRYGENKLRRTKEMKDFVYVTKKEHTPLKNKLIELINLVQDEVREYFTFSFKFIGSADRNMITCDYTMNVGFDFDVNIYVNDDDEEFTAEEIKKILKSGFDKHVKKFSYDYAEDSKRVLTIKVKDIENSRIIHSCDFAVVYDTSDGRQQYIHFNKTQNTYEWQYQPDGFYELPKRIEFLKSHGHWQEVRDDYLNRKNTNTVASKKSRSLFAETINALYNYYSN